MRLVVFLAALVLSILPAQAQSFDLLKMPCSQYVAEGPDGQLMIASALRGRLMDHNDEMTSFAVWRTQQYQQQYVTLCQAKPDELIAKVIEQQLFQIEPYVLGAIYARTGRCNNLAPGINTPSLLMISSYYYGYVTGGDTLVLDAEVSENLATLISRCREAPETRLLDMADAVFGQ